MPQDKQELSLFYKIAGGLLLAGIGAASLWLAYGNLTEARHGQAAARGSYGTPGTVTFTGRSKGIKSSTCRGDFRPRTGPVRKFVKVQYPGSCTPGRQEQASLAVSRSPVDGEGTEVAWVKGAGDWAVQYLAAAVLLLLGLGLWVLTFLAVRPRRREPSRT